MPDRVALESLSVIDSWKDEIYGLEALDGPQAT
jgi:hypothetical protein